MVFPVRLFQHVLFSATVRERIQVTILKKEKTTTDYLELSPKTIIFASRIIKHRRHEHRSNDKDNR